ncbi:uncharacterized protein A4U43_C01F22680 [Asparagus officinalis]|uniref:Uncharacterized protein n=1 Tax=Asparagus officinalis TaxID=4686 RepID=A0A5P1FVP6_ASPOF|nr:uncharacterized protein LOC109827697 isoform X2 [Asparagus officinalis]ONK80871.1 uncharacterized protein A4U43_C01F22680 [Asparagus officinalis]
MLATLIYTLITDGSPFRSELFTPWLTATLIDFYVNVVAIAVWVAYNESSWVNTILWIILLICFGSITTCVYIVRKLVNVSTRGPEDPVRLILSRNDGHQKMTCCSLLMWRVVFSVLAVFMSAVVIYTVATDGLPFRKELLTPWMAATLIDFYINVLAISVWVAHKESTWVGTVIWICLLICFGSITTCTYIAIQLFRLSDGDPMYYILLDHHSKPAD